jgi:hypothetical protein
MPNSVVRTGYQYYYFSTEILRRHFHHSSEHLVGEEHENPSFVTRENCIKNLLTESFTPEQCHYLSADVFSLGIFFIQILTSSNIYNKNFFEGRLKIIQYLVPKKSKRPKKLIKKLEGKIDQIKGEFNLLNSCIEHMVSHLPSKRPNIFKVKSKIEQLLFNESFGIIGLNRHEFYRIMFNGMNINETAKLSHTKTKSS